MNGDYDKCGDDDEGDDEAHTVWGGSDYGSQNGCHVRQLSTSVEQIGILLLRSWTVLTVAISLYQSVCSYKNNICN